jgi:hypothetical protein
VIAAKDFMAAVVGWSECECVKVVEDVEYEDVVSSSLYTLLKVQRQCASLLPYCGTQILSIQIRRPRLIGLSIVIQMNLHHNAGDVG